MVEAADRSAATGQTVHLPLAGQSERGPQP
jgi:hypothetical protein